MAVGHETRATLNRRWGALVQERSSWMTHWREIATQLLPRSGKFLDTNAIGSANRGDKKHQNIYDSTATRSLRIMSAGLLAGMTSPARPWFRLRTADDELNESEPVRIWLHTVEKRMRHVFNQSNTYRTLRFLYEELGAFGTGGSIYLPHFEDIVRHRPMTIGEYAIGTDDDGNVDTVYRSFQMNVSQIVQRFGVVNISEHVKSLYDAKNLGAWIPVTHAIEPRRERNPLKIDAKNKPWTSVYFETQGNDDNILRISGFDRFVGLIPRWQTRAQDMYGSSPGMEALGDIKQLQHQQLRKSQGIDYKTLPPLQAPAAFKEVGISTKPGEVTYVDVANQQVRSLFDVNIDLDHLLIDIQDVRTRIKQAFFEDLFLMLIGDTRSGITATEIVERQEEKLLMLGPVLESLQDELLAPMIEMTFEYMLEAGMVPPPPEEMEGKPLVIQFVSLLAQAQKLVGIGSVDRLIGSVQSIADSKPDVWDKVDTDQYVDELGDLLGVNPKLIVSDKKVALIRADRAQAAQQQAMIEAAPELARATKDFREGQQGIGSADAVFGTRGV